MSTSPETQHILDLCHALEAGQVQLEQELHQAISRRQQEMDAACDGFFAAIERQGKEFLDKYRREIAEVEKQFNAYDAAMEVILSFQPGSPSASLGQGAQALEDASAGLRLAMTAYEQRFLSQGPSKYPIVNLFTNLSQALLGGRANHQSWDATCRQYLAFYTEVLKELDQVPLRGESGGPQRRQACVSILQTLEQLARCKAPEQFARALAELARGHEDLEAAVEIFNRQWNSNPTSSSSVNSILRAVNGVLRGKYAPTILSGLAHDLRRRIANGIEELQAVSRIPTESVALLEEVPRMLEAMETMDDALVTILECKPLTRTPLLEHALDDLAEAGERLQASTDTIRILAQSRGQLPCPQCQSPNLPSHRVCQECQAILPRVFGADEGETSTFQILEGSTHDLSRDAVMTDVMKALFEACEATEKGRMSGDELLARLDACEDKLHQSKHLLRQFKPPAISPQATPEEAAQAQQFVDLAQDALDLLELGVEECELGLEKIRRAVTDDLWGELREGQRLYYEGVQKLWQIRRVDDILQRYLQPLQEHIPIDEQDRVEIVP